MTHFIQTNRARYKCKVRDWSPVYDDPYIRVFEKKGWFIFKRWSAVHELPIDTVMDPYWKVASKSICMDAVLDYENELRQRALQKV